MTQNRRAKRAIRAQMAQTGEKYTEARRALLGAGGDDGRETPPGVGVNRPDDPLAWFTDQAYNVILLAEDEARMLGCATVEPEHLLLALARSGNAQRLLLGCRIDARAIHDAVVGMSGFGDELVRGPLPRSSASQAALRGALTEAAARGTLGPSSEHLLLALAEHASVSRVLAELGVADVRAVVDATYPVTGPPVDAAAIELRTRRRGGRVRTPPSPGPVPPLFERFTVEAHEAVGAGVKRARVLDDPYVELAHLLHGLLEPGGGLVAAVCVGHGWQLEPAAPTGVERFRRATGIFTAAARRIVAEDVLEVAARFGHRELGTGHLLLAILEHPDQSTAELIESLPDVRRLAAEVTDALPGDERA